jgi:EthD domain
MVGRHQTETTGRGEAAPGCFTSVRVKARSGCPFEPKRTSPCDGNAEIWFNDMAGFLGVFGSSTYEEVIKPDEMKFVDRS